MTLVFNKIYNACVFLIVLICAIVTGNGCSSSLHSEKITMVVVTATNCHSCETTDDGIEYITQNFPDTQIKTVEIHTAEGAMYVSTYRLWRVPVYLFLDTKGRELYRLEGEQNRNTLNEAITIAKQRLGK